MDVREYVISSVFFHAVLILLMMATSYSFLNTANSVMMIDFAMDAARSSPGSREADSASETAPAVPEQPKAESREELPAAEPQPVVPETVREPEPAAVAEPVTEPPPPPVVEAAVPSDEFRQRMAKRHRMMIVHMLAYVETASRSLLTSIGRELAVVIPEGIENASAEIQYSFDDKGGFHGVHAVSDSEQLLAVLGQVDWKSVPYPSVYMLRLRGLSVRLVIENGRPFVSVSPM